MIGHKLVNTFNTDRAYLLLLFFNMTLRYQLIDLKRSRFKSLNKPYQ